MTAEDELRLQISPEVERLMEDRQILRGDVQKVIGQAESTGDKFINPATGRSLACLRPVRVNYWVEYSHAGGDGYLVHNAWSHRMETKRGGGA